MVWSSGSHLPDLPEKPTKLMEEGAEPFIICSFCNLAELRGEEIRERSEKLGSSGKVEVWGDKEVLIRRCK